MAACIGGVFSGMPPENVIAIDAVPFRYSGRPQ